MECDMKKLPDKAKIVEQIITELGRPLRQHRSEAEAYAAVERAIKMLGVGYGRPRPDAASIRKHAKNLHKALEPVGDRMPIMLKDCDRPHMPLQEFRSATDWFESRNGPAPTFDDDKFLAALVAYGLVNEFSQKPPTGTAPQRPGPRDRRLSLSVARRREMG
jgi:hypothetical protein